MVLWWVFWLPASLVDAGYQLRYDIGSPYLWPSAASQVGATALVAWLIARPSKTRTLDEVLFLALLLVIFWFRDAVVVWAWLESQAFYALFASAFIVSAVLYLSKLPMSYRPLALLIALESLLFFLWGLVYQFGDRFGWLNNFGRSLIY
jgi:hypothetical protein